MQQQLLPLEIAETSYKECDFIVSYCNLEAYKAISTSIAWPDSRLLIIGETGSGKTHLSRIWSERNNAQYIQSSNDLLIYKSMALILENIETYSDNEIFHIINYN